MVSESIVMNRVFYKWVLKIIKTFMNPNRPQKCHSNRWTIIAALWAISPATLSWNRCSGCVLRRSRSQVQLPLSTRRQGLSFWARRNGGVLPLAILSAYCSLTPNVSSAPTPHPKSVNPIHSIRFCSQKTKLRVGPKFLPQWTCGQDQSSRWGCARAVRTPSISLQDQSQERRVRAVAPWASGSL